MLVSYKWLNEFVDTGLPVEKMGHALTMAGLEIEGREAVEDDFALEVNVTPNRPDCLSVLGLARELRAITGKPMNLPAHDVKDTGKTDFRVEIADLELCNRYAGRVVRGIKIAPSPEWMKQRLDMCGIRSINNIVDITNYVLLEFGHPLHAFDLATLKGGMIRVAVAGKNNTITTLDGSERKLPDNALLIWDAERPVAVAGVMGGAETEVSQSTTEIFIESAWFRPESVRRTSRQMGLSTEASYRFERGTDVIMLEAALDRAAALVAELAGGTVESMVDVWPVKAEAEPIKARYSFINRLLGTEIAADEMLRLLRGLGLEIREDGQDFYVTPPPYRPDMTIEADIAEEVARLYGYDNIPTHLPLANLAPTGGSDINRKRLASIKGLLNVQGFHDAVNYSFMNPAHLDLLSIPEGDPRRSAVKVKNPLRAEDGLMRTTLVPTLVSNLAYNMARGASEVRLFETAKVFIAEEGQQLPSELHKLGGVIMSTVQQALYPESTEPFYLVKGLLESVFDMFRVRDVLWLRSAEPFLHPGKSADIVIGGGRLGFIGVLAPSVMQGFEVKARQDAVVFEIDMDTLMCLVPDKPTYRSIPRYPSSSRDIAMFVDEAVEVATIMAIVKNSAPEGLLESVSLFDFYKGKGVPEGKKSLAFNMVYRSLERTLKDAEVDDAHSAVTEAIVKGTGAEVRGA